MKKNSKVKNPHEQGYVSFTPEDMQNAAKENSANHEAYELLDEAMTTSSHISANVKNKFENGGTVSIDDVYPITAEETAEMEQLLDKAEQVAGDPKDTFFNERLNELRDIVIFSKKRHWTFSWLVIIGVLVMVGYLWYSVLDSEREMINAKKDVELVKNWAEQDTVIKMSDIKPISYSLQFSSANLYKAYKLKRLFENYETSTKYADKYTAMADTAKTDERKTEYKKYAEKSRKDADQHLSEYKEINEMKFEQIKEKALEEANKSSERSAGNHRSVQIWCWFFILLIPLYIIAEHPYGYTMSRYRTESKVKGGIMKWTYAISAGLATAGATMGFIQTITTYGSGRKERSYEAGTNAPIIAIKILLYLAAVVILCLVSCFIMLWSTISGLKRNYDWKVIMAKISKNVNKK